MCSFKFKGSTTFSKFYGERNVQRTGTDGTLGTSGVSYRRVDIKQQIRSRSSNVRTVSIMLNLNARFRFSNPFDRFTRRRPKTSTDRRKTKTDSPSPREEEKKKHDLVPHYHRTGTRARAVAGLRRSAFFRWTSGADRDVRREERRVYRVQWGDSWVFNEVVHIRKYNLTDAYTLR